MKNNNKPLGKNIHPWEKWFKRKNLVLSQGIDFECAVHGLAQQFRNKAPRFGKRCSIKMNGIELHVAIKENV